MKRIGRIVFRVGTVASAVVLVALWVFLWSTEPALGRHGALFVKTPWGVGRVYLEQTLHLCWLRPWPVAAERGWGMRLGQVSISDGYEDAVLVGPERGHSIGEIEIVSGQIAIQSRTLAANGPFGPAVPHTTPRWDWPIMLGGHVPAGASAGTPMAMWMAYVPWWIIYAALAVLPGIWVAMAGRRMSEKRQRVGMFCANCGYDLRATPERCPECGTSVKFETRHSNEESSSKFE